MIDSDMEDGASESCADPGEPPNLKYVFMDINNISSRYTEVCPVSCSAKSIVFSALDHHGERLAVKKVVKYFNIFFVCICFESQNNY